MTADWSQVDKAALRVRNATRLRISGEATLDERWRESGSNRADPRQNSDAFDEASVAGKREAKEEN